MAKKNESLEDCVAKLKSVVELINRSFTLTGFIERIVNQFMPILRTHPATKRKIEAWEDEILDNSLSLTAYQELEEGFNAIIRKAESSGEDSIIEVMKNIRSKATRGGDYRIEPDPPYKRVLPHFRAFYMNLISTDDIFAPSVLLLEEKNSYMDQLVETDKNPSYLWRFLLVLEDLWKMDSNNFCFTWDPIDEIGLNQWLEADRRWKYARQSFLSSRLKTNDFDKSFYERLLERLVLELPFHEERSSPYSQDKKRLHDFINAYWKKKPQAIVDEILRVLKKKIAENPGWLERRQEDSTLRTRIRECDKRSKKPRGPGKKSF